jgi:predicted metalloendopeptidase
MIIFSDVALDGNLTLTENLADHGGLKMAHSAYATWKLTNQDSRLPALPYTDLQLFFLGKYPAFTIL